MAASRDSPALDVAGGLVEDQPVVDAFLDEQETAGSVGNGRDGDFGRAGHGEDCNRRRAAGLRSDQPRRAARRPCSAALAFHT